MKFVLSQDDILKLKFKKRDLTQKDENYFGDPTSHYCVKIVDGNNLINPDFCCDVPTLCKLGILDSTILGNDTIAEYLSDKAANRKLCIRYGKQSQIEQLAVWSDIDDVIVSDNTLDLAKNLLQSSNENQ